jgi:hypothetical protein
MVVDAGRDAIIPHTKTLVADGYGYSCMVGGSPEEYDRGEMMEILADWSWSGDAALRPAWLPK